MSVFVRNIAYIVMCMFDSKIANTANVCGCDINITNMGNVCIWLETLPIWKMCVFVINIANMANVCVC